MNTESMMLGSFSIQNHRHLSLYVRSSPEYEPEWLAPQSPLSEAEIAEFLAQCDDVANPAVAITITVAPIVTAAVPLATADVSIAAAAPSVSASSNQQTSIAVGMQPETALQTAPTCPVCKEDLMDRVAEGVKLVATKTCGHIMCKDCLIKSLNLKFVDPWGITVRPNQGQCPSCRGKVSAGKRGYVELFPQ